jgi:hypothetical protein
MMGEIAFGMMWRTSTATGRLPLAAGGLHEFTRSRCSGTRCGSSAPMAASSPGDGEDDGPDGGVRTATSRIASTNAGMVWKISVNRIIRSSVVRPGTPGDGAHRHADDQGHAVEATPDHQRHARAVRMMPEAMSRPRLSVPSSMPSVPGGAKGAPAMSQGSPGKRTGASQRPHQATEQDCKAEHAARVAQKRPKLSFILCHLTARRGSTRRWIRSVRRFTEITRTDMTRKRPSRTG